ncbi:MAG: hypothetical protein CG439_2943, partial [Methylococcaceae bacterium NSP1-2]
MKISAFLKILLVLSSFYFSTFSFAESNNNQATEVACHYVTKVIPHGKVKASSSNDWFFWR